MDMMVNEKNSSIKAEVGGNDTLKKSIRKMLYSTLGNALDDETRRANQEMTEEREKAIKLIADEQKSAIRQFVEEEKKTIWTKTQEGRQSEFISRGFIQDFLSQAYMPEKSAVDGNAKDVPNSDSNHDGQVYEELVELEILPPRDQNEIDIINKYLNSLPEVTSAELITSVDKSIIKVVLKEPMDFVERLSAIPQVLNAEEIYGNGRKRIMITLLAKSKLERNHVEINSKVNKIFLKKKQS